MKNVPEDAQTPQVPTAGYDDWDDDDDVSFYSREDYETMPFLEAFCECIIAGDREARKRGNERRGRRPYMTNWL